MVESSSSPAETPVPRGAGKNPAPGLLEVGIDVTSYDPPELSNRIWREIEERVLAVRGVDNRWELACALPQRCGQRLAAGETERELAAWLRDVAVGELLRSSRGIRMSVIETSLPIRLLEKVNQGRRQLSRWWPGRLSRTERDLAISQWCEEWAGQLASGTSVETLLQEPLKTRVREVRSVQWQQRGWLSKLVGHTRRVVGWLLLVGGLVYGVLWVRLALLQPRPGNGDLLAGFGEATRNLPAEQRGWPLVKQFWEKTNAQSNASLQITVRTALLTGPSHPAWAEARTQLESVADSLGLLLEASRKTHLGYPFPALQLPYQSGQLANLQVVMSYYRWQTLLLSQSVTLMQGEAHRALEQSDPDRAVEMAIAALRLARLAVRGENIPAVIQLGEASISQIVDLIGQLCESDDMSVAALDRLREALMEPQQFVESPKVEVVGLLVDQLDRFYSSDSNGAMTRQGLEILVSESFMTGSLAPVVQWLYWPWNGSWLAPGQSPFAAHVQPLAPVIAPLMVRRQAAVAEVERVVAAARQKADSSGDIDAFVQHLTDEVTVLTQTEWSRIHYAPVISVLQSSAAILREVTAPVVDTRPRLAAERAMVVKISFERYRRRTGAFPADLADLVPVELSELPLDPFDNRPLKWLKSGNGWFLYAVGEDGTDDSASWKPVDSTRPIHPGDLRLLQITSRGAGL